MEVKCSKHRFYRGICVIKLKSTMRPELLLANMGNVNLNGNVVCHFYCISIDTIILGLIIIFNRYLCQTLHRIHTRGDICMCLVSFTCT